MAVVPLAVDGEIAAADRAAIDGAVAEELAAAGNRVLGPAEAQSAIQARDARSWSSRSISGMSAVLIEMGWDTMVTGRVSASPDTATTLTLEAFETRRAIPLLREGETGVAAVAGHDTLVRLARTVARELVRKLADTPRTARLRISTDPPRAQLVVNGEPAGQAPWEGDVPAGTVFLRASAEGYLPAVQEVVLEPGDTRDVPLRLLPRPDGERPAGGRSKASWQLPAGIAGLGLGAGLAIYGGYWLTTSSCLERDPRGPCVRQLGTSDRLVFGVLPLAAGVLVAAAGALVAFVFELGPDLGALE